jgi:HPt (histidine-containing phosphotransfer) domain-containing protein
MSGYDATRVLRARERPDGPRVPIIALTAHALPEEADRVREAGMDALLIKPTSLAQLGAVLEQFISRAREPTPRVQAEPRLQTEPRVQAEPPTPRLEPGHRRSPSLVRVFLEAVPAQIEALDEATQQQNYEEVRARAHRLKGSAASVGAARLSALCADVEIAAAHAGGSPVRAGVERIVLEFRELRALLEAQLEAATHQNGQA